MSSRYTLPPNAVWFRTSSGIGRAFAEIISASTKGYRLVAAARNISALNYLPDSPNVLKVSLDIVSPKGTQDAVQRAIEKFGRIDVLINNAAYSVLGDTEATTDEQARAVFETVFWGAANLTREAVRVMREENPKSGTIGGVAIYMSSPGGRLALPGGSYYYATRFAMNGFYEGFTKELNPDWDIHLMIAEPGFVKTDYLTKSIVVTERHPAYLDPKCATNQVLGMMEQAQQVLEVAATPETLAQIVMEVVETSTGGAGIPLRLPLGPDSLAMINNSLKKQLEENELVKPYAERFVASGSSAFQKFHDMV